MALSLYGIIDKFRLQKKQSGALNGKTFMVKDLFDVQGKSSGNGNPSWQVWRQQNQMPPAPVNAPCVEKLLDAGAILTGRTQCDELALSLDGINENYSTPLNTLYPERIPGGSSSGSAAVTAGGLVDFALGTDTLGSVRVPAAYCGLFGIRPGHGSVPIEGVIPLGPSFDTVGWFSKDPELIGAVNNVLTGESSQSTSFTARKVILPDVHFDIVHDSHRVPLYEKARAVSNNIAPVHDIALDLRTLDMWILVFSIIRSQEAWQYYGDWVDSGQARISESILPRLLEGKNLTVSEVDFARRVKIAAEQLIASYFAGDSIICIPTTWNLPAPLNSSEEVLSEYRRANSRLSILSVISGLPQLAFPVRLDAQAVMSLSFLGPPGSESGLISLVFDLVDQKLIGESW